MLQGSTLTYFDSQDSTKEIKSLVLHKSDSVEPYRLEKPDPNLVYTFRIVTHKRVLELCASNEIEMINWMNVIRVHIKNSADYTLSEKR